MEVVSSTHNGNRKGSADTQLATGGSEISQGSQKASMQGLYFSDLISAELLGHLHLLQALTVRLCDTSEYHM